MRSFTDVSAQERSRVSFEEQAVRCFEHVEFGGAR